MCISAGGALGKVICRHRDMTVDTLCISAGGALGKVICRHRDITVDTLCISAGGGLEKVICRHRDMTVAHYVYQLVERWSRLYVDIGISL